MIRFLQEHLAFIQLQGGNNPLLEWIMQKTYQQFKTQFPTIWIRNSYYFKAHHPLVSDIDITYLGDINTAKALFTKMKNNKLMGELNFYPQEIYSSLLELINPLEGQRDPLLMAQTSGPNVSSAQKEVFLLRHVIADHFWLLRNPLIRHKKWDYILGIAQENMCQLSLENLISKIQSQEALHCYLKGQGENLFTYFKDSPYRGIFPHKHIWGDQDLDYLSQLSAQCREILIEQVKWEFWGIATQLHWIDLTISLEFLTRLKNIIIPLGIDDKSLQALERILHFMHQLSQTNH